MQRKQNMADPQDVSWRTQSFRQNVRGKIEEAIRQSGNPTTKSAAEMENHVFQKAKSKEEYLSFVARLIIHVREMNREIYQSKWFAFNSFDFLRNKDTSTNSINTENHCDDEEAPEQRSEGSLQYLEESSQQLIVSHEQNELTNTICSSSDESSNTPASANEDQGLAQADNVLERMSNVPRDECTTFGKLIGTKLQKFGEQKRSVLMHIINTLIFEAETELYSQAHISSSAASSPPCSAPQCILHPPYSHSQPYRTT